MKLYLIAAALFVLAFVMLGVLTASMMSGPDQPAKPHAASGPPRGGGTTGTYETPQGFARPRAAEQNPPTLSPGTTTAPGAPTTPRGMPAAPVVPVPPASSGQVSVPVIPQTSGNDSRGK